MSSWVATAPVSGARSWANPNVTFRGIADSGVFKARFEEIWGESVPG